MATVLELKNKLRSDLDDTVEPYFWEDDELIQYLNESMDEACIRSRSIRDTDTPEVCQFRTRPNKSRYDLDRRILRLHRVYVEGQVRPLEEKHQDGMDTDCPGWQLQKAENPTGYTSDIDACWIRLFPIPTTSKLVTMTVQRLQLEPLSLKYSDRCPELHVSHHYPLLEWAKHLAMSKQDAETIDPDAQARCAAKFAEFFGNRRTAEEQQLLREHKKSLRVRAHFL